MKHITPRNIIILAGIFSLGSHTTFCKADWRTKAHDIERKIRSLITEFKNDAPVYQALKATIEPYADELTMRTEEVGEASTFVNSRFDEIQRNRDASIAMDEALDQAIADYEAQIALSTTLLAAKKIELENKTVEYNELVGDDSEKAAFLLAAINDLRSEYDNLTLQRAELIKKINAIKTALEGFAQVEEGEKV